MLCTGNSCRSQLLQGYLQQALGDRAAVYSAGIETHGLNPRAVRAMAEDGVDIAHPGFRPALGFLGGLGLVGPDGRVATAGTHALALPGLWLVGYGSWTGFALATLIGVGRSARTTVAEIKGFLE